MVSKIIDWFMLGIYNANIYIAILLALVLTILCMPIYYLIISIIGLITN